MEIERHLPSTKTTLCKLYNDLLLTGIQDNNGRLKSVSFWSSKKECLMKILFPQFSLFIVNEPLLKRLLGTFHFLFPKDNRNPNPQIFAGAVWKTKSGGFIFCRHFWKVCRVQFWSASLKKKNPNPPVRKPVILIGGWGAGEGIKNGTSLGNERDV